MPTKLPLSLVKPPVPQYTIRSMPLGEEFDFNSSAMLVDADGSCYLDPDEEVREVGFIKIRRDETGYHVALRLSTLQWTPEAIPDQKKVTLIPVASLLLPKGGHED